MKRLLQTLIAPVLGLVLSAAPFVGAQGQTMSDTTTYEPTSYDSLYTNPGKYPGNYRSETPEGALKLEQTTRCVTRDGAYHIIQSDDVLELEYVKTFIPGEEKDSSLAIVQQVFNLSADPVTVVGQNTSYIPTANPSALLQAKVQETARSCRTSAYLSAEQAAALAENTPYLGLIFPEQR